jgi:hypothetical protein
MYIVVSNRLMRAFGVDITGDGMTSNNSNSNNSNKNMFLYKLEAVVHHKGKVHLLCNSLGVHAINTNWLWRW